MEKLQIKICGMREAENIRAVEETACAACESEAGLCGGLWMGFIFYPRSPRFAAERPAYLPGKMRRVGVFVDDEIDHIAALARRFRLDAVQLHGHESPGFCREVRRRLQGEARRPLRVFKAFSLASAADLQATADFDGAADLFIFDTKSPSYGGSGRRFDWEILGAYAGRTPFLLSGGIGVQCLRELRRFRHPRLAGYDLNSCFETAPGVKDPLRIEAFLSGLSLEKNESEQNKENI